MPTPVVTPKPADLDAQAAKLREQAAGLNRRQAAREEAVRTDLGSRFDDVTRVSAEGRAAANMATEQAKKLHDQARQSLDLARRLEADADQRALSFDPHEREVADDVREQAQMARTSAVSSTRRAQRSEQVARQKLDDVERADRDTVRIRRAHADATDRLGNMRHAANSLEDKAKLLEQGADELRAADQATTPQEQAEHLLKARQALGRAEAVSPDFSRIDPQDIVGAGIPMTEVPGAELMRPTAMTAPVDSRPVNDTDLKRPDSLDPVTSSPGPTPSTSSGDADDTALMHDDAGDPVLGTTSPDLRGTSLTDPSAQSSLAGDGLSDPWERTAADLGSDAVPYREVPDAGDLGSTAVDAPAASAPVEVASASASTDVYVDQPDASPTSSYGDGASGVADGASTEDVMW